VVEEGVEGTPKSRASGSNAKVRFEARLVLEKAGLTHKEMLSRSKAVPALGSDARQAKPPRRLPDKAGTALLQALSAAFTFSCVSPAEKAGDLQPHGS
jgi:hypothetical protein